MQYLLWGKRSLIFFIVFSISISAFSQQELNNEEHDDKPFHFGINVGYNRAHYNFTHHSIFQTQDSIMVVESINSSGIRLAALFNVKLNNYLAFRTFPIDLNFTEKAFEYQLPKPNRVYGEDSTMIKKVQGITLAIPAQIKFQSDRYGNFRTFILAGGKVEWDLAANKTLKNQDQMIKLEKMDYGIMGGIGFHIYFPVFVLTPELRIDFGLRNMHARDSNFKFSNVLDKVNARQITFSLTVE